MQLTSPMLHVFDVPVEARFGGGPALCLCKLRCLGAVRMPLRHVTALCLCRLRCLGAVRMQMQAKESRNARIHGSDGPCMVRQEADF